MEHKLCPHTWGMGNGNKAIFLFLIVKLVFKLWRSTKM